jgi:uncharacterized membrane protein YjgN (DUF898 family)
MESLLIGYQMVAHTTVNAKTESHMGKEHLFSLMVPNILESLLMVPFVDSFRSHLLMVAHMWVLLEMELLMGKVKLRTLMVHTTMENGKLVSQMVLENLLKNFKFMKVKFVQVKNKDKVK